ncbi:uncharacterized protein [Ptychodera flava]|uniref:uncharacterized protein n=1 Tax=Ptychodera flava TaxID=63121 RepID=UPI00396A7615
MASDDSEDDDHKSLKEEMLTCQLCFEVYKTPKLLSCQHSFCEHCLERWVQTNHGRLVCPCCRQHVSLPVGGVKGLPPNRVISHFFDYIDRSKRKAAESQGVPCETCSSKNADRRCIECSQYLCGRCSTVHSKGKMTRKHRIMSIEDFETEKLTNPTIEQPETYCEKHSDAAIEVFCQTCETCVCVKCALTEHPNPTHQYVSVDKAAVKPKEDFREFVQKLDQDRIRTADARNAVVLEILQLEENLKTGMEKINKHVDKIIQNAREMQKKTQETYRKAFELKNNVLKSQIQNLERREKSLSNTREFAEMQINYASSAQFLLLKDEMKQQIQNVLTTSVNTDLEENSCLDFELDASPAVNEFGHVQTSSAVGHMSELSGLSTEILQVGEEHTLNIRTKDCKGCDVAVAPYVHVQANLIQFMDDVIGQINIPLPVEISAWNESLCHVTMEFPTEGNYHLKVSVCGQPLSGTPKLMRAYSAGKVPERTEDLALRVSGKKSVESIPRVYKYDRHFLLQKQCKRASLKKPHVILRIPNVVPIASLFENVEDILNHISKSQFQHYLDKLKALKINTQEELKSIVKQLHEKATAESCSETLVEVYVKLCKELVLTEVPSSHDFKEKVKFGDLLIEQCKNDFQKRDLINLNTGTSLAGDRWSSVLQKQKLFIMKLMTGLFFVEKKTCFVLPAARLMKEICADVNMADTKEEMEKCIAHIKKILNDEDVSKEARKILQDTVELSAKPHQQRQHRPSGMSMQRPVAPQSQMMYSKSSAKKGLQQQAHPQQQAIYIPQQTTNYQPGVRQAYPRPVAKQASGHTTPSTPPYYTPSQPRPNPELCTRQATTTSTPTTTQPMAPPVQYRQQEQTYSGQPVQKCTAIYPPPIKLIQITDPNKGVDVTDEIMKSSSNSSVTTSSTANITPPFSERSSASGTPPQIPQSATLPPSQQQIQGNSIAAQFAAQVAATLDGPDIGNIDESPESDGEYDWLPGYLRPLTYKRKDSKES